MVAAYRENKREVEKWRGSNPSLCQIAVCFAFSPSGQQAIEATNTSFVPEWNKHDPAELQKHLPLTPYSSLLPATLLAARMQQYYEKLFPTVHSALDSTHDFDRVEMLSDDLAVAAGHRNLSNPPARDFGARFTHARAQHGPSRIRRVVEG
jgi:hypothetical protein